MNLRIATGYLTRAADAAFTAPAPGAASVRKVLFDLIVRDSRGAEFPEKCFIEDAALQRAHEAKLVPGAALLIEGEPISRPFYQHGVQKGFTRETRVTRVEFMRVPATAATPGDDAVMTGGSE